MSKIDVKVMKNPPIGDTKYVDCRRKHQYKKAKNGGYLPHCAASYSPRNTLLYAEHPTHRRKKP